MGEIIILGTAFAVPGDDAENAHFLYKADGKIFLVDCASNPMLHIPKSGVDIHAIDDIILTHFHPDHVSGVPLLLMGLWLQGRRKAMNLYGSDHTLDRLLTMMELFDYESWPNFFPLHLHRIELKERARVYADEQLRIFSSPVKHLIPTLGLRLDLVDEDISFAYSCDTEPCEEVIRLAQDCKLLLHEASGETVGHTSAYQAGEIATKAGVEKLYLIHYPTKKSLHEKLVEHAQSSFSGSVELTKDFMNIQL